MGVDIIPFTYYIYATYIIGLTAGDRKGSLYSPPTEGTPILEYWRRI